MPTLVSVVENGWEATRALPPVSALNRADLPAFGNPTMPSRSIVVRVIACTTVSSAMSKKTNKRKIRARRKKANHGKRPNVGRR